MDYDYIRTQEAKCAITHRTHKNHFIIFRITGIFLLDPNWFRLKSRSKSLYSNYDCWWYVVGFLYVLIYECINDKKKTLEFNLIIFFKNKNKFLKTFKHFLLKYHFSSFHLAFKFANKISLLVKSWQTVFTCNYIIRQLPFDGLSYRDIFVKRCVWASIFNHFLHMNTEFY